MARTSALVTGANGEIGRALLLSLADSGSYDLVTLDLTPLPDDLRPLVAASYAGNIMDRYLLDQIAAHHDVDVVFHLAALLSTRSERDPELAHRVNVEGTLNVLRTSQAQSARGGRPVRFVFPSSVAVYGLPTHSEKRAVGKVREDQWNVPITMYGCNKLYCEHLGRYFSQHARQLGALSTRLDFRALRFPGLISATTVPSGGTSDFGAEMIHAAARGAAYTCFVEPDAQIPFMAMPDAVRALVALADADRANLTRCVYNVSAFSVTAEAIAERVRGAFPGAVIDYEPDALRARIVASWPEDMDVTRARKEWGFSPRYGWDAMFDEYLVPSLSSHQPR
jgi:nucleoside-diphosphate-sugar epimerase